MEKILGEGCSSVVKEVKLISNVNMLEELKLEESDEELNPNQNYAVKIIRTPDDELMDVAYNEFKLLKNLDHPGIVKMHDAFLN